MDEGLKILLGATVADAAARPLQWIKKTKASKEIISHKKNLINI